MDDLAAQRAEARAERHAAERAHAATINWTLINELHRKPHPLLNLTEGEQYGILIDGKFDDCCNSVGEVMQEARTAHHLLDMAGIPRGTGYSSDVDARTYLAITELGTLRERLARIAGWHARETGPAGTVGDFCTECGARWPCDTRRMAEGSYADEEAEKTHG
jgi:hypothetical protein